MKLDYVNLILPEGVFGSRRHSLGVGRCDVNEGGLLWRRF